MDATQGTSRRDERQNKAASGFLGVAGFKSGNSRPSFLLRRCHSPSFMLKPPHSPHCHIQIMGSVWEKGQPKSQCCCCVELTAVGVVFLASRILFLLATGPGILPHPDLSNHESP